MDFTLVKELKDAGFLLKEHDYFEIYGYEGEYESCWCGLHKSEARSDYCTPTLSELIEACGSAFNSVKRHPDESGFTADGTTLPVTTVMVVDLHCYAVTPEWAVAKLWLALNKK